MEKEKILFKIQKEAGTIPLHSVCKSCENFISIFDALALFPHCGTTQQDIREILDSRNPNNCKQDTSELLSRCQ